MAPKNKKKNSFYFFMKEMQEKEQAKGRRIAIADIPQVAHPIWAKMSLVEREPYEEMARQFKNDPSLRNGKLASDGTRVEDNIREVEEKIRLDTQMRQAVKNYCQVQVIPDEQFKELASRQPFYFISFNLLCQTENNFIPNEVGLVEYSIKDGIHRIYHKLLHPGRIPTGYAGEAKRLNEIHEIDIYGESESQKDLRKVYNEIRDFTNPENLEEYPPLFCIAENIELNIGCLDYLAYWANQPNYFDVYNAAYLLCELRLGVHAEIPSNTIASDLLTKPNFNYHPCARCSFHEEKDNNNCALAYSKRLCYLLSDSLCLHFDVELTERHIPAISLEEKAYTVIIPNDLGRSKTKNYAPPLPLDSRNSYYAGSEYDEDTFSDVQSNISSSVTGGHRQPASTCLAAEMARLRLNMTSATVPGHGIGRGQRR